MVLSVTLLAGGCGSDSQTIVDNLPESENLFFTEDGRLFVSGGESVFEIIQSTTGEYVKLDMFNGQCLVEGIIQRYDYLYAVCSKTNLSEFADSYLLAAQISQQSPMIDEVIEAGVHPLMTLQVIASMESVGIPNGMEVDEAGYLYIADSGKGDIVRVTLATPTEVSAIEIWSESIAPFVNGLEWVGDELYFTGLKAGTLNSVFGRVQRNPDGSAGSSEVLYQRASTVLDDLVYDGEGFIITDYLRGSLLYWQEGKVVAETPADTFFAPTAVVQAQPPMFDSNALVVTEKGIIFNGNPRLGNKVGLYYPEF